MWQTEFSRRPPNGTEILLAQLLCQVAAFGGSKDASIHKMAPWILDAATKSRMDAEAVKDKRAKRRALVGALHQESKGDGTD